MTTPQGGVGPVLAFAHDAADGGLLAAGNGLGGSFWPALGILSHVIIALAVVCHLVQSYRAGRFELSAGVILLGLSGAFLGLIYAVVHREWMLVAAEALGVIVAARLLATLKPEETPAPPPVEKPRLPVVAPDSAEIKLTALQPRQPQR
ncbi:MAG: hypothetical protein DCC65_07415 [Planctomycetota bacterium]|nr:MAG: hypothetical protein DCC65_07415 [Planctomycetota bacterium]